MVFSVALTLRCFLFDVALAFAHAPPKPQAATRSTRGLFAATGEASLRKRMLRALGELRGGVQGRAYRRSAEGERSMTLDERPSQVDTHVDVASELFTLEARSLDGASGQQ
jgi:hypothetical protein